MTSLTVTDARRDFFELVKGATHGHIVFVTSAAKPQLKIIAKQNKNLTAENAEVAENK